MKILSLVILAFFTSILAYGQIESSQNRSLDFDGFEDLVTSPFLNDSIYTIEFWIKSDVGIDGASQASLPFNFSNETQYISLNNCCSGLNSETISLNNGFYYPYGPPTATDQVLTVGWHHIAFTSNGTTYNKIYIDGELANMISIESPVLINTQLLIGYRIIDSEYGSAPFGGKIDEIRLWKIERTALEIQENMNSELIGIEPNLILYYKMNNINSQCDFEDCSGNQNYGVRTGVDFDNNLPQISVDAPSLYLYPCQVDINCSEVLSTSDFKNDGLFIISPNPMESGRATILFNDILKKAKIKITNLLGQTIHEMQINNETSIKIDLNNHSNGMYYIKLEHLGKISSKRLVKH